MWVQREADEEEIRDQWLTEKAADAHSIRPDLVYEVKPMRASTSDRKMRWIKGERDGQQRDRARHRVY